MCLPRPFKADLFLRPDREAVRTAEAVPRVGAPSEAEERTVLLQDRAVIRFPAGPDRAAGMAVLVTAGAARLFMVPGQVEEGMVPVMAPATALPAATAPVLPVDFFILIYPHNPGNRSRSSCVLTS